MAEDKYIHGSTELRAHARAAVTLSEARARLEALRLKPDVSEDNLENAEVALAAASAAEYAARIVYTNPFDIEKTFS